MLFFFSNLFLHVESSLDNLYRDFRSTQRYKLNEYRLYKIK